MRNTAPLVPAARRTNWVALASHYSFDMDAAACVTTRQADATFVFDRPVTQLCLTFVDFDGNDQFNTAYRDLVPVTIDGGTTEGPGVFTATPANPAQVQQVGMTTAFQSALRTPFRETRRMRT